MTEDAHTRSVRAAYDTVAAAYAEHFREELSRRVVARGVLGSFAELVRAADLEPVADVGCGPGHVTAHLHSLGLTVRGVDLSPGMVEVAGRTYPHIPFEVAPMTALNAVDGSLGGLVAWYSLIHLEPDRVPAALGEFHRVLAPGGQLALAFQIGEEPLLITEAFGQEISLEFRRWTLPRMVELARQAGFVVTTQVRREPDEVETAPQAHVLAYKPASSAGGERG